MGAADIVPGVSGGTVALILGHYQRLVTAISHFDTKLLADLRARRWGDAWTHLDGRFLLTLGFGLATAILSLATLMHWLLEHRFSETMAVFFGLVAASGLLVARFVQRWDIPAIVACLAAVQVAWVVASLTPVAGEPSTLFLFAAGAIAICAMILPGISGAFVLLLLGAYHPVTGMLKQLTAGDISLLLLTRIAVFSLGCGIGLLMFSKVLRKLLLQFPSLTFAALLGLMIGSLRKLWPLQAPTPNTAQFEFKDRVYQFVDFSEWTGPTWSLMALAVGAMIFVLGLDYITRKQASTSSTQN